MGRSPSQPLSSLSHCGQANSSSAWSFQVAAMSTSSVHTALTQMMKTVAHTNTSRQGTPRYWFWSGPCLQSIHCMQQCIWVGCFPIYAQNCTFCNGSCICNGKVKIPFASNSDTAWSQLCKGQYQVSSGALHKKPNKQTEVLDHSYQKFCWILLWTCIFVNQGPAILSNPRGCHPIITPYLNGHVWCSWSCQVDLTVYTIGVVQWRLWIMFQ